MNNIEKPKKEKNIFIMNLPEHAEEIEHICIQLNLMRDILIVKHVVFIFLAPAYIDFYIGQKLPNLYDYFVMIQRYSVNYTCILDALLPQKNYLITKTEYSYQKKFVKKNFLYNYTPIKEVDSKIMEELNWNLDFFCTIKSNREVIEEFISRRLNPVIVILETENEYRTIFKLYLKVADMFQMQKDYITADIYFQKANDVSGLSDISMQDIADLAIGIAANCYYTKDYLQAQKMYESIDVFYESENDNFNRSLVGVCISACHIQQKKYEDAIQRLNMVLVLCKEINENFDRIVFSAKYNYLLALVFLNDEYEWTEYNEIVSQIKSDVLFVVEKAMLYALLGWIEGVVFGRLDIAVKYAIEAIEQKRTSFIENDIRIADSHYINAVLFFMKSDFERAAKCCRKCLNILKNHSEAYFKIETAQNFLEMISLQNTLNGSDPN